LRNQFRSLDEDEVDFLDSVLESTRSKEAEVKKETREQLEAFRKQQEDAEKAARADDGAGSEALPPAESWSLGPRKRKKGHEKEVLGGVVKLRKASTAEREAGREAKSPSATVEQPRPSAQAGSVSKSASPVAVAVVSKDEKVETSKAAPSTGPTALGLVAYSSDEDD